MKTIALMLCLLLALTACAPTPAATQTPPPPPDILHAAVQSDREATRRMVGDCVEVRWLIPVMLTDSELVEVRKRVEDIAQQANTLLAENGLWLEIVLHPVQLTPQEPGQDNPSRFFYSLTNDISELLVAEERYDLISLPVNNMQVSRLIEDGLLREITGDLSLYSHLSDALKGMHLQDLLVGSGLYGVPAGFDLEDNISQSYLAIKLDEGVAPDIADLEALLAYAEQAKRDQKPYTIHFPRAPEAFRRSYDEFPFLVSQDFMFLYTRDGDVTSYLTSTVAQKDMEIAGRIWGMIDEADTPLVSSPNFMATLPAHVASAPQPFEHALVKLSPERPQILYRNAFGKILNVIPSYVYDSYGLAFLDALYGNPALYALFEDTEWLFGGSGIEPAYWAPLSQARKLSATALDPTRSTSDTLRNNFSLYDCVMRVTATAYDETSSADADYYVYESMPFDGFTFDPSPVQGVYDAVAMAMHQYDGSPQDIFNGLMTPMLMDMLIENVKNAGYDEVLAECQRQYTAFLANKGWSGKAALPAAQL